MTEGFGGSTLNQEQFGFTEEIDEAQDTLHSRFGVPPFSVLDARQGYWRKRKTEWFDLGIVTEAGRDEMPSSVMRTTKMMDDGTSYNRGSMGGSAFDPVLAELIYRWFCPKGGSILDPFAGESVKGIVAEYLGYKYTGIEVRQEQVDANYEQAAKVGVKPNWVTGDSSKVNRTLPAKSKFDLVFTSPPYYDLEIYSDDTADGSTKQTYREFMEWYMDIFAQCVSRLKENRFLVVKVGEIRDKKGEFRNFVGQNVALFKKLGLHYYNEAVLITPTGSLPVRVSCQFPKGLKLGKGHQNILGFWKGDLKNIKAFAKSMEGNRC